MADPASNPANRPWVAGSGADGAPAIAGRPDPPAMERGEDRAQKRRLDLGKTHREPIIEHGKDARRKPLQGFVRTEQTSSSL
jgi:hypothetical protein